jgi:hypothetical protein
MVGQMGQLCVSVGTWITRTGYLVELYLAIRYMLCMQVVELFRLFRETEFAEALGDAFIVPTMCGTGGDSQVRRLTSVARLCLQCIRSSL